MHALHIFAVEAREAEGWTRRLEGRGSIPIEWLGEAFDWPREVGKDRPRLKGQASPNI